MTDLDLSDILRAKHERHGGKKDWTMIKNRIVQALLRPLVWLFGALVLFFLASFWMLLAIAERVGFSR